MTKAAAELFVAQSAVSTAIGALEETLDTQLFVRRRSKGVTLTTSREELLRRARTILADVDDTLGQISGSSARGPVDVACFQNLAPFYLPEIAWRLNERHPDIIPRILECDLSEVNNSLSTQVVELALTYDLGLGPDIKKEVLAELPLYAAVAADHPLAGRDSVSLDDLMQFSMVLLDLPVTREYLLSGFTSRGLAPSIAFRFTNYETVRAMVARGEGFTVLNLRPASGSTYGGHDIVSIPISDPMPVLNVVLAAPARASLSSRAQLFAEICRDVITQAGSASTAPDDVLPLVA
jgi:DNA-binding transcriptional LysR family regulator